MVVDNTVQWLQLNLKETGLPVGFEYFTTNPNIPAGSLPLQGGLYSRLAYPDLWEWVQKQPGYLKTESEWQELAVNNGGNVPFYSKGDGSSTFRVPALKCWVKGANSISEVGGYLPAGLPNITGSTAQPPSIVGLWCVKAYGTVTNVGSTDVANIAQGLTELENRVTPIANGGTGATTAKQARANLEVEPIGTIFAFAGNNIPSGYLPCNGGAISRTTYADLFAVIGTTYGSGDGSTTFNLPNLNNNSFLEGSDTVGTVKSAGLPNINGSVLFRGADSDGLSISQTVPNNKGAFNISRANEIFNTAYTTKLKGTGQYLYIDASRSSSVYGNSITVQPKSVTVKFCIKY